MIVIILIVAASLAVVTLALVAHALWHHLRSSRTVAREAERWGWDEGRKAHELRAMKRRHGLPMKLKRVVRAPRGRR